MTAKAKDSKAAKASKRGEPKQLPTAKDQAKKIVKQLHSGPAFLRRKIPARTWLVEQAIPHPSLGLLYAWRGSGKTYTALRLAIDLANGDDFMVYSVPQRRTVLFVDGEMPISDLQERVRHLSNGKAPERLYILASEDLAMAHINLNLAERHGRQLINQVVVHMEKRGHPPDLIILDNWASLVRGLNENDNSALDEIKEWLMRFRHAGVSVLFIHHAGKEGQQRGASAREDHPDYSIVLEERQGEPGDKATHIVFEWDKIRGQKPEPRRFRMVLYEDETGQLKLEPDDDAARGDPPAWLEYVYWWASHGRPTDRKGAEAYGIHVKSVERNMKAARQQGVVTGSQGSSRGRRLTRKGVERLRQFWPHFSPDDFAEIPNGGDDDE